MACLHLTSHACGTVLGVAVCQKRSALRRRCSFCSLGLGISAATAIFTVVYSVLIAQLPFPDSERLIVVDETDRGRPVTASPQRFRDWLRAPSIAHVMAYYSEDLSVRIGDAPERIAGIRTFGDPLETLNVQPAAGRGFTEAEKRGTGPRVAVITSALWRTRFGAQPGVVGRHITLNGEPCEIVGILAARSSPRRCRDHLARVESGSAQVRPVPRSDCEAAAGSIA